MCLFIYLPLCSAGRGLGLTPEGNRHAAEVILFPFVWDPQREVLYLHGVSSSSHTCTFQKGLMVLGFLSPNSSLLPIFYSIL